MGKTVLIVEDETRLAEILGEYLAREGFRTERAKDGKRALELWRAARPDLILLDVRLEGESGLALLAELRRRESLVRVLFLTSFLDEDYLREAVARQLLIASVTSEQGVGGSVRTSICPIERSDDGRCHVRKEGTVVSYGEDADDLHVWLQSQTAVAAPNRAKAAPSTSNGRRTWTSSATSPR